MHARKRHLLVVARRTTGGQQAFSGLLKGWHRDGCGTLPTLQTLVCTCPARLPPAFSPLRLLSFLLLLQGPSQPHPARKPPTTPSQLGSQVPWVLGVDEPWVLGVAHPHWETPSVPAPLWASVCPSAAGGLRPACLHDFQLSRARSPICPITCLFGLACSEC